MSMPETTATVAAHIPREMRDELNQLAKSTGRNKNALVEEALRRFIEVEKWQITLIEERIREADAGNFATDEEVARVYAKFGARRSGHAERAVG